MQAALVYPHQLFPRHPAVEGADLCVLVEDPLFFRQYAFHAQKLVLHRASMAHWAQTQAKQGRRVETVPSSMLQHTADIVPWLQAQGVTRVRLVDPCDDWLQRRLTTALQQAGLPWELLPDPHFLTPVEVYHEFGDRKRLWYFTDFYTQQRRRLDILVEMNGRPVGDKWSFDADNRQKLPKGLEIPPRSVPKATAEVKAARLSVARDFPHAPGDPGQFAYPTTPAQARQGLAHFLDQHLLSFGEYEDAISSTETFLFHSVLTPALNTGLLAPREVIDKALERQDDIPINSLEGFIRQIIGWREYVRGAYLCLGRRQRRENFFQHTLPMPRACYDGTTGIEPVDTVIRRVRDHAYCHHIERLMILGNFFLLCGIHPTAVYQWFMELFIDAYDWVMVPNVYGMSQYADQGWITTKPYVSGSAYVLKMSNFKRGPWCPIWDALYWRFISQNEYRFINIPRMSLPVRQAVLMGTKLRDHIDTAERFLDQLHGGSGARAAVGKDQDD